MALRVIRRGTGLLRGLAPVLLALLASALPGCGGGDPAVSGAEPAATSTPLTATLDALIPRAMTEAGVPGLAVAVVDGGRVVYEEAFGVRNRESGEPVTPETVFEAASLSKPVFAYRVLKLVEDGRLELDRPLATTFRQPWVDDPRAEAITPRHVLAHTTGFPNWRPRRFTDHPGPLTMDAEPGSRFGYSGEGYMYLQAAVEELTGRPVAEELEEELLEPLGMEASSFVWRPEYAETAATGHNDDGSPGEKFKPEAAWVAGSLHTTAGDFARFLLATLGQPPAGPDHALSPATLESMLSPAVEVEPGLSWGLGWGLEETAAHGRLFWHWGDNDTFKAMAFGSPSSGRAVVVFTNARSGLRAARAVVEAVFPGDHPALGFHMVNY